MVASNTQNSIRCYVVEVPVEPYAGRLLETRRRREMLPWADPYIAGLVQRLKLEIESERITRNEASPPLHNDNLDFEQPDRDAWPMPDEIY